MKNAKLSPKSLVNCLVASLTLSMLAGCQALNLPLEQLGQLAKASPQPGAQPSSRPSASVPAASPQPSALASVQPAPAPSLAPQTGPSPRLGSPSPRPTLNPSRPPLRPSPLPTASTPPLASASPVTLPTSVPAPDFSKLSLALELHVENRMLATPEEIDYVLQLAEAARTAGVTLSIGLGVDFLADFRRTPSITAPINGSFTLNSLVSRLQTTLGHSVTLHADVDQSASYEAILAYLPPYIAQLNSAGAQGNIASGACNETNSNGGWVRGAYDAGLRTIAGVVEDCQASLSQSLYPSLWLDPATASPGRNHSAAPTANPAQRVAGWFPQDVSTWITPYTPTSRTELDASLFIVGSMGPTHPACLAELAAGTTCTTSTPNTTADQGRADANAMLTELGTSVDSYRSGTRGDAYHTAFSTNMVVGSDWINAYFSTLANSIATGVSPAGRRLADHLQYSTLSAVAEANRQEVSATLP